MAGNSQWPIRLDSARRILLVKPSALGDVVHALPVAATLKQRYPNIALDWLVEEEAADILRDHPAISDLVVSGRRRWLRSLRAGGGVCRSLREMRDFVARLRRHRYDAVLDLQCLLKSALYVVASGAPLRVGLDDAREGAGWVLTHRVPTPPQPVHAVDRYLAMATALDATAWRREFAIRVSQEARSRVDGLLAGLPPRRVAIHPSTRWETKLWEAAEWRTVAAALAMEGYGVVLTGSGGDAAGAAAITEGLPAVRSLAGQLSLKELAALLGRVDVLVTLDSGPMHVAGAMGTPVVALFGPTDPRRTGPIGPATILRRNLPCSPCLSRTCRIPETRRCMREIRAAEVLEATRGWLRDGTAEGTTCECL